MMKKTKILKELKALLLKHFGDDIEEVILFGSQVNGKAREYSDYDVLIILKNDYDWRYKDKISAVCNKIDLKYEVFIDDKIISQRELSTLKGRVPFVLDALETGIRI